MPRIDGPHNHSVDTDCFSAGSRVREQLLQQEATTLETSSCIVARAVRELLVSMPSFYYGCALGGTEAAGVARTPLACGLE